MYHGKNHKLYIQERSEQVYQFVQNYLLEQGYAPSSKEIGISCKMTIASVQYHLARLKHKGRLDYQRGISRSIHILNSIPS